ncbi:hypothetical protein DE146DRAFT_637562 [Phaeosphaeria sp. MPI-PUGE-AT-0046c]|nr:hypothetical protein DE146DRAFT_637562 [Phaeosphaeria sp. MPI-PUGE-AT-0046c]
MTANSFASGICQKCLDFDPGNSPYQGCYRSTGILGQPVLNGASLLGQTGLTDAICRNFCTTAASGRPYLFFGIQGGTNCYCGNTSPATVAGLPNESLCTTPNSGDSKQAGGGPNAINVWAINPTSSTPLSSSQTSSSASVSLSGGLSSGLSSSLPTGVVVTQPSSSSVPGISSVSSGSSRAEPLVSASSSSASISVGSTASLSGSLSGSASSPSSISSPGASASVQSESLSGLSSVSSPTGSSSPGLSPLSTAASSSSGLASSSSGLASSSSGLASSSSGLASSSSGLASSISGLTSSSSGLASLPSISSTSAGVSSLPAGTPVADPGSLNYHADPNSQYLGCLSPIGLNGQPLFDGPSTYNASITQVTCGQFCRSQSGGPYEFYAIEQGNLCHCSKTLVASNAVIDNSGCNMGAQGDPTQAGGGRNRGAVFRDLTPPHTTCLHSQNPCTQHHDSTQPWRPASTSTIEIFIYELSILKECTKRLIGKLLLLSVMGDCGGIGLNNFHKI